MSDWQPIETAPKDGTTILIFLPRMKNPICLGRWWDKVELEHGVETYRRAEWMRNGMPAMSTLKFEPTHWMPLPEPPRERIALDALPPIPPGSEGQTVLLSELGRRIAQGVPLPTPDELRAAIDAWHVVKIAGGET